MSSNGENEAETPVPADSLIAQFIESPNLRLLGRVALRLGIITALIAATYISLEMRREVRQDPRFRLENWSFQFGAFPDWVTPRIRGEIEELRRDALGGSSREGGTVFQGTVFQEGLLSRVRRRIEANGWVRSVEDLRLTYPGVDVEGRAGGGGLVIAMRLREPIAVVSYRGKYYHVDEEGICPGGPVPGDEFERGAVLPVIRGTEAFQRLPAPEPGQHWKVEQILEGIEVAYVLHARRINERFPENPVVAIDISNVGGALRPDDTEILVIARGETPIVLGWGRSPISTAARTVSLARLIDKLEAILAEPHRYLRGTSSRDVLLRLDLGGDRSYLQVRGPELGVRETSL